MKSARAGPRKRKIPAQCSGAGLSSIQKVPHPDHDQGGHFCSNTLREEDRGVGASERTPTLPFTCRECADPTYPPRRRWSDQFPGGTASTIERALGRAIENMEAFFQILESLPDGLLTTDIDGKVTYFNPTAQHLTGLSPEDVIGKRCNEVLSGSACSRASYFKGFALEGERSTSVEFDIRNPNGAVFPVMSTASPIHDAKGRVVGAVEVFKDISTSRALENELRKSEQKYRRIFAGSKDMIFIVDKAGSLKEVNEAGVEMLGYRTKEELLSIGSFEDIWVKPLHARVFQKQINRWGYIKDFETFLKTKDGVRLHCLLTGNGMLNDGQEIIGYEGIAKDITARMHAVNSLQQRNRELSLLYSVASAMNTTQDLDSMLLIALQKVLDVLGAKKGGVFLVERMKSAFSLAAEQGLIDGASSDSCEMILTDAELMHCLLSRNFKLSPEPSFPPFTGTLALKPGSGGGAKLTCFLIPGREAPLGFLAVGLNDDACITEQDLALLGSLGNFLGGAIENSLLHQQVRQRSQELRELTARLFHTQEEERKRIARELHDDAGQSLTGINLILDAIDKKLPDDAAHVRDLIADVKKQIHHTYQGMRRLSHKLHPAILNDLGLKAALDADISRTRKHSNIEIEYRVVGFESHIDPELAIALYRLSQEAFTNTLKHAKATHFALSIIKSYPRIIFVAEDDGEGFEPSDINWLAGSLGLVSMRERAAMMGGSFVLRSSRGHGTQIRIEIPVKESRDED